MAKNNSGDFKLELKYFEAAIEALASDKNRKEAVRVRNFGNAILNVAIKTKQRMEKPKQDGKIKR